MNLSIIETNENEIRSIDDIILVNVKEIKILKNDIFLLTYQVCGKHGKPAYLILLLDQSVHFNRKFYTEKDWKMLIEVMNEMQY